MRRSRSTPEIMDDNQCADYLGISYNTLRNWRIRWSIPYMPAGHGNRYMKSQVDAWILSRTKGRLSTGESADRGGSSVQQKAGSNPAGARNLREVPHGRA